ncbi:hypothetical protein GCM10027174_11950 [Salinifilum aidingensis]
MTWQDELQQLDAEFEAGRISAEEHRRRREALLGAGSTAQPDASEQDAPEQSQHGPAGAGQEPAAGGVDPFPPPFTWPGSNRSGEQGRNEQPHPPPAPQSPRPAQQHGPAPRPQQPAQPDPQPQQDQSQQPEQATEQNAPVSPAAQLPPEMGRAQSPADANSTQIVDPQQLGQVQAAQQGQAAPQAPPQQPPGPGQPQPVQQPWPQQPWGGQHPQQGWGVNTAGTPWGNAEIPPPDGGAPWLRHTPGGFEEPIERKPKRGKLYAWLSVVGVLVVAGAVAAVALFVPLGSGDEQAQQPTSQPAPPPPSPTPTTSAPPEPPAPKPAPKDSGQVLVPSPKPPHPWAGGLDRRAWASPKGQVLKPRQVRDFALNNGLRGGWFSGSEGPGPRVTMLALRMPNERTARSVADRYLQAQRDLSPVDEMSYQGVEVLGGDATYRTAYVAHDWAVIVDVSGEPEQSKQADSLFSRVLDAQLAKTPPTVRD